MSSYEDLCDAKEAIEVEETANLNEELNLMIQNEIISDFEKPEQYLLYYSRIGDTDKLRKLFDLLENENAPLDINVKG